MEDVFRSVLWDTVSPSVCGETLILAVDDDLRVSSDPPWSYQTEKLDAAEQMSAKDSSSVLRREGIAGDYVRGSTVQKPFTPAGIPVRQHVLDRTFARRRFNAFVRGDYGVTLPYKLLNTKVALFSPSMQDTETIQAFERTADELEAMEVNRARQAAQEGEIYVLGDNVSSAVQKSLKQEGFRLDSVFQRGDERLFGMEEDEEEEEDEDEEEEEERNNEEEKDEDEADVDDLEEHSFDETITELDRLLGDVDRFERKSMKQKLKEEKEGRKWASEDTSDVTNFRKIVPNPVREYPFDLDPFQKRAIMHLEKNENVFVAAHTSAGKTVVAEYAIALAEYHQTKVIYTSPIKTLSNQKFRDFSETFHEVGIVTGDVSLRQDAACLVMTTEILRSMLYKGAGLIRDVEWVIFDEVHYVNDIERGVVWEEVIIMLPEHINIVMLSATVPNAMEFAEWVGRARRSKVFVVSTMKRPVPLEHSLFVRKESYLLMSSAKKFMSKNYSNALKADEEGQKNMRGRPRHQWSTLVQYLKKNDLMPTVVFCFSKKKCDEAAESLRQTDLSDGTSEKAQVHTVFELALSRLSPADRELPQLLRVKEMLKRGIGVHHAGLLPIVKEVTEILFQRGIVRILFATETFAMGVNMPARTVVFSSLRKHDGRQFRFLQPGEYTQMAGRAGRRGLDKIGNVLLYFAPGEIPSMLELSNILIGRPLELVSQFRLTYNMILNLLRIEELRVEDMIRRSFAEAPAGRDTRKIKRMIDKGMKTLAALHSKEDFLSRFVDYYDMWEEVSSLTTRLSTEIFALGSSGIRPGVVVLLQRHDRGLGIAVVIRGPKSTSTSTFSAKAELTMLVLILHGGPGAGESRFYDPSPSSGESRVSDCGGIKYQIREVRASETIAVTKSTLKVNVAKVSPLRGKRDIAAVASTLEELRVIAESTNSSLTESIDPRKDLRMTDIGFVDAWNRRDFLVSQLAYHPLAGSPRLGEALDSLEQMRQLEVRIERLQWAVSDDSLQLKPDYRHRLEVLQLLNYVTEDDTVQLKGRTACEVNTCDSLVLTELIFENVFEELKPDECAAVLAALVCQEKTTEDPRIPPQLEATKTSVERIVHALGTVQEQCNLPVSPMEYSRFTVQWALTELVLNWARGEKFNDVLKYAPEIPEGSVVRCVVRLSELLRETRNVARVIGDIALLNKMEEAMELIKRDIIFAASLYLT